MSKNQHLCDWERKDIENDFASLVSLIQNPKYICKKCARAANSENVLCKAQKIKKSLLNKN